MLILASASPRRQELLRNAGIPFSVQVAKIPEEHRHGESPETYVRRLAREKAQVVAKRNGMEKDKPILAADTEVVLDLSSGTPLGKPRDADDAVRMLRQLSGRDHYVITGVCLLLEDKGGNAQVHEGAETTLVRMREISDSEIRDYVATGEPLDKAGAYAIQGIASRWIPRIEGCYFNVVGLPVPLMYGMLREFAPQTLAGASPARQK
jgi:septum formation protein